MTIHGATALQNLLDSIPAGPDWNHGNPVNNWDAATAAVDNADVETMRAALSRLLALHLFDLQTEVPQVAMRNVKVCDVVQLGGVARTVYGVDVRGENNETVYLKVRLSHAENTENPPKLQWDTFAYDADVKIPLLARDSEF